MSETKVSIRTEVVDELHPDNRSWVIAVAEGFEPLARRSCPNEVCEVEQLDPTTEGELGARCVGQAECGLCENQQKYQSGLDYEVRNADRTDHPEEGMIDWSDYSSDIGISSPAAVSLIGPTSERIEEAASVLLSKIAELTKPYKAGGQSQES